MDFQEYFNKKREIHIKSVPLEKEEVEKNLEVSRIILYFSEKEKHILPKLPIDLKKIKKYYFLITNWYDETINKELQEFKFDLLIFDNIHYKIYLAETNETSKEKLLPLIIKRMLLERWQKATLLVSENWIWIFWYHPLL